MICPLAYSLGRYPRHHWPFVMITTIELARAKEAVSALLEHLGLAAYLFEIEWRDEQWLLRVDCAIREGWQSLSFPVDKGLLVRSANDATARQQLLTAWRGQLQACMTEAWVEPRSHR